LYLFGLAIDNAMTPILLRQIWSLLENTQANILLGQDDASLASWVLQQLTSQQMLEQHETEIVNNYIRSKTSLIRDLAAQR